MTDERNIASAIHESSSAGTTGQPESEGVCLLNGEPPWLWWRLRCAPGFARSACLIASQVGGMAEFVLDRAEHAERRV